MALSTVIVGMDTKNAVKIYRRDPVSYTHLDVYKRQTDYGSKSLKEDEYLKIHAGRLNGAEMENLLKELSPGPVSYTHLDVYKRQLYHRFLRGSSL